MNRQNSIYTNNLTRNFAQIVNFHYFMNNLDPPQYQAPICKITKGYNYYLNHASKYLSLQLLVKCHACQGWRLLDMNLFN